MARKKTNNFLSVFTIFFKSIKLYFLYLDKTSKYLLLPIFGQILGLMFIFLITYYFNMNASSLSKIALLNTPNHMLIFFFAVLAPFFALFMYSFYRYIIAFSSLNILFYTISNKKKVKEVDFKANDSIIERKLFQYVILMFFVSILCFFPPLWIALCLSFQIFSFESDTNSIKAISRSVQMTMGNFFSTITMLGLVFAFSYCFLPNLFIWSLEKINLISLLVSKAEVYFQILPYDDYNSILALVNQHIDSVTIAKCVVEGTLTLIIIGFTLPFRCACFSELYRIFDNKNIKEYSKESEEIIKRANSKVSKKRKN